jgi:hypothetical protein
MVGLIVELFGSSWRMLILILILVASLHVLMRPLEDLKTEGLHTSGVPAV